MTTAADISTKLEETFRTIEQERMHDVPILNEKLQVQAVDFQEWREFWLGVLITPWFMNLMLLPREDTEPSWENKQVGSKHMFDFPAGRFEFIAGHEDALGQFLICSLFSPVFEFADQDAAEVTARTVIEEIHKEADPSEVNERDVEMQQVWEGKLPAYEDVSTSVSFDEERDNQVPSDEQTEVKPAQADFSRRELLRGFNREKERDLS